MLLVINEQSKISRSVGDDYTRKRKITHVVRVRCADATQDQDSETITFPDYRKQIEHPIANFLAAHTEVQFIVLTKGIPLRITGADTGCRPDDSPPTTPLNAPISAPINII